MSLYFQDFEFDLPKALIDALVKMLNDMPSAPLTDEYVSAVDNVQGVYQIFLDGDLVYIGKTDAELGLNSRLRRHSRKILGRLNLDVERVTFKAVRIYVFTAMDLEQLLIAHYGLNSKNSWNNSGFGSNDPGKERDTTQLKPHHFDKRYPIDYRGEIVLSNVDAVLSVHEVLNLLRTTTPYVFRFQSADKGGRVHEELLQARLPITACHRETLGGILLKIRGALGPNWKVTPLPGYVIGYKETRGYAEEVDIS